MTYNAVFNVGHYVMTENITNHLRYLVFLKNKGALRNQKPETKKQRKLRSQQPETVLYKNILEIESYK